MCVRQRQVFIKGGNIFYVRTQAFDVLQLEIECGICYVYVWRVGGVRMEVDHHQNYIKNFIC